MNKAKGTLYLIPSFLSASNDAAFISEYNKQIINGLRYFIVENLRTARRYLRAIGYQADFNQVWFKELDKHADYDHPAAYIKALEEGQNAGLISEAGMPCIADPGAVIVKMAHERNIRVVPLAGGSSIIMALVASGMNGQQFAFNGYLPLAKDERIKKIRDLERIAETSGLTQIFMETPYRNNQLVELLLKTLKPSTRLSIAADISNPDDEFILSKQIGEWAAHLPDLHKKPTIFLIAV